ncbi:LPS export ABC transporter permease LptG [Candidatus Thioglobus sp.]|nr:LPS export ABC transporter permease LptG [Candidatus Thioglobus sp.]MDA8981560.1 LPS export ABC transporter permease LptG [Candidatus Thioglobus sp.]
MKIRDRYIAKTLLSYTIIVLVVWISIYSFFNFLAELNSVGKDGYTILSAFIYIILQLPEVAYKQASPIILLGCILGMGNLASTGQLLIFRVSGASILKITLLTLKNSLIFVLFFILIGEFLAPISSNFAKSSKLNVMGGSSASFNQEGFWIRDGDNFINVNKNIDGTLFSGITVIEVNSSNRIERVIRSENALFDGNSLNMSDSEIFSIDESSSFENISLKERNSYDKTVSFDQDLINSLKKEPEDLSTWTLIKQIRFLSDNKLRSGIYEVELYKRLIQPVTLVAMILLAMLFIFGSTRDVTLGRKIFFGVALGLSFEMSSRVASAMALSFDFSPFLSSILPSIVVMFISIILLLKKSFS